MRHARRFLTAVLTGCAVMSAAAVAGSATLEPYEINAIIPLTGGGAFLGKAYVETFRAVEQLVNSTGAEMYFTTLRSGTPEGTSRGPLHDAETAYLRGVLK